MRRDAKHTSNLAHRSAQSFVATAINLQIKAVSGVPLRPVQNVLSYPRKLVAVVALSLPRC